MPLFKVKNKKTLSNKRKKDRSRKTHTRINRKKS